MTWFDIIIIEAQVMGRADMYGLVSLKDLFHVRDRRERRKE
jgi:hypothetical protein